MRRSAYIVPRRTYYGNPSASARVGKFDSFMMRSVLSFFLSRSLSSLRARATTKVDCDDDGLLAPMLHLFPLTFHSNYYMRYFAILFKRRPNGLFNRVILFLSCRPGEYFKIKIFFLFSSFVNYSSLFAVFLYAASIL